MFMPHRYQLPLGQGLLAQTDIGSLRPKSPRTDFSLPSFDYFSLAEPPQPMIAAEDLGLLHLSSGLLSIPAPGVLDPSEAALAVCASPWGLKPQQGDCQYQPLVSLTSTKLFLPCTILGSVALTGLYARCSSGTLWPPQILHSHSPVLQCLNLNIEEITRKQCNSFRPHQGYTSCHIPPLRSWLDSPAHRVPPFSWQSAVFSSFPCSLLAWIASPSPKAGLMYS